MAAVRTCLLEEDGASRYKIQQLAQLNRHIPVMWSKTHQTNSDALYHITERHVTNLAAWIIKVTADSVVISKILLYDWAAWI